MRRGCWPAVKRGNKSTLRLSLTRVRIKESFLRILLHIPKEFLVVYDFVLFVESCSKNTGAWSLDGEQRGTRPSLGAPVLL